MVLQTWIFWILCDHGAARTETVSDGRQVPGSGPGVRSASPDLFFGAQARALFSRPTFQSVRRGQFRISQPLADPVEDDPAHLVYFHHSYWR